MPWIKGFNFRNSPGYVTDGPNETYVLRTDTYPTIRNGVTFGFEDIWTFGFDRNNTNDRRLAGIVGDASFPKRFRVDLPVNGTVKIRLALGDAGSGQTINFQTKDNAAVVDTYAALSPGANSFIDASGVARTAAAWPGSNVQVTRTFASTIFRIQTHAASSTSVLAHLELDVPGVVVTPDPPPPTINFNLGIASGLSIGTYEFIINGVSRGPTKTFTVERNSFYFEERLASRNNGAMTVSVDMLSGGPEPTVRHGHTVEVLKNSQKVFAGRVRQPRRYMDGLGQSRKRYVCSIVDYSEAFDRRLVIATYENKTLKQIVEEINSTFLAGEGFSTDGVDTGPLIKKLTLAYKTVTYAFNELQKLSGMAYWVDFNQVIQFRERTSIVGDPITESNAFNFEATEHVEGYRNVQYVRAGLQLTSNRTEPFVGDGVRRTFVVGFTIGKVPTVEENRGAGWVTKSVAIKGLHTGYDWYWNKGSAEITQDNAGVVLSTTDQVRVTYQGQFPISYQREDAGEISLRSSIEGHSGRYEALDEDRSLDDPVAALDKTIALLEKYGMIADKVKCETYQDGYHAGQLVTVTHAKLPLSGTYLIESITVNPVTPIKWRYTLHLVGGNSIGNWQDFYLRLANLGSQDVIAEDEIIQLSSSKTDSVTCADVLTVNTFAPESRAGFATIDFSEAG